MDVEALSPPQPSQIETTSPRAFIWTVGVLTDPLPAGAIVSTAFQPAVAE